MANSIATSSSGRPSGLGPASSRVGPVGAAALTLLGVGAATAVYGTMIERRAFRLRRVESRILPPGSAPLRVLHLSDFHVAPWQRKKQEFVRGLAALKPDLVVGTGDNLGHVDAVPTVAHMLEPFEGIPSVHVYGSNDYLGPVLKNPFTYFGHSAHVAKKAPHLDTKSLTGHFNRLGWTPLNNMAAVLEVAGRRIRFFGVNDPHIDGDDFAATGEALREASEGRDWDLTIALAHAPYQRVLSGLVDLGADAIFAGHTHGGQVCVPGYGALVTNCDIPREQVKGLSIWTSRGRTAALHVSAGLGTSIYAPVRFACPPEATLLTFLPRVS